MTAQVMNKAAETAAVIGFGRKRMLEIARQLTRRPVKRIDELSDEESADYLMVLEVMAPTH